MDMGKKAYISPDDQPEGGYLCPQPESGNTVPLGDLLNWLLVGGGGG